ncbi:MAG: hydrogenase maturation protease [Thermoproteus sp. AZ2]|uniref:Hydrogenase maturation protease n=1 Tax=Thermoproteus sp. AZ2 TaxID=1609232 RepID=A0ACC6UZB5_9CREN|nr:MAG: hypothetical protein TU35_06945 [Thermoproteus sp. AZ2]
MRVLVVGLGNPLYGDDGLGSCLARALSDNAFVVDGDARGFDVATSLGGYDVVYIIDVVDFLKPGEVKLIELEAEEANPVELTALDVHRVPPTRLVQYAKSMAGFKGKAYLIAVGAGRIDLMAPPSREALSAIGEVLRVLEGELARYGLKLARARDVEEKVLRCYAEAGVYA